MLYRDMKNVSGSRGPYIYNRRMCIATPMYEDLAHQNVLIPVPVPIITHKLYRTTSFVPVKSKQNKRHVHVFVLLVGLNVRCHTTT